MFLRIWWFCCLVCVDALLLAVSVMGFGWLVITLKQWIYDWWCMFRMILILVFDGCFYDACVYK